MMIKATERQIDAAQAKAHELRINLVGYVDGIDEATYNRLERSMIVYLLEAALNVVTEPINWIDQGAVNNDNPTAD